MGVLSSASSTPKQLVSGAPLPEAVPGGFQTRDEAVKAYMAHLDAVNRPEAPFAPVSVPLYPAESGAEAEDLTAGRTPRWRGG